MKVSYYPGCSLKGTARDYEDSLKSVCGLLDIELEELEDWNCCGATAAHSLDHRVSVNLPARNLEIAEAAGRDLLVPCPLCFNRLKTAEHELRSERAGDYDVVLTGGKVHIWDLANYMAQEPVLDAMEKQIKTELKGLKPVCYYGCMASRPPAVTGEADYENPMSMDRILERLGVEPIPWSHKTDCCGASHLVARPDIVYELVGRLYGQADRAGANCIVVSCQMCQANLDLHQVKILEQIGADYRLPVLYFTDVIALALGHQDSKKWLKRHFVEPFDLLKEQCRLDIG